jgi:lipoate-protein ligase B
MSSEGLKRIFRIDRGRTCYKNAWRLQKRLVDLRFRSRIPDCLLLTEHEPVITMGRASSESNLLCSPAELRERGVELFEIERGGDITFHGPGQLVVYPIVDLNGRGRDLHRYLRDLESVVVATLHDLGLDAGTKHGLTGVWVDDHKLAAIGVAVSRWIAYHGLALNVNTDLDYFKLINPCGITRYPVGSISSMLGEDVDLQKTADLLAGNFARLFDTEIAEAKNIDSILSEPVEA